MFQARPSQEQLAPAAEPRERTLGQRSLELGGLLLFGATLVGGATYFGDSKPSPSEAPPPSPENQPHSALVTHSQADLYQALPSLAALTDAAIKLKPLASHFQPLLPSPLDNDAAALLQYTVNLLESRAVELRATTQPMEAQLALAKLLDDAEGAVRMLEPEVKRISRTSLGSDRRPEATAFILTFDELAKATAATKEQFGPHDPSLASR